MMGELEGKGRSRKAKLGSLSLALYFRFRGERIRGGFFGKKEERQTFSKRGWGGGGAIRIDQKGESQTKQRGRSEGISSQI